MSGAAISPRRMVAGAAVASIMLVTIYLALGGSSYEPTEVADPCAQREWREPSGIEESAQQFGLSALDGAACELGVSRETLAEAVATESSRESFAAAYGIEDAELEAAVRAGVLRAIDDAEQAGALNPIVADGLRLTGSRLPVDEGIALIEDASQLFEDAEGIAGRAGDVLEGLELAIP